MFQNKSFNLVIRKVCFVILIIFATGLLASETPVEGGVFKRASRLKTETSDTHLSFRKVLNHIMKPMMSHLKPGNFSIYQKGRPRTKLRFRDFFGLGHGVSYDREQTFLKKTVHLVPTKGRVRRQTGLDEEGGGVGCVDEGEWLASVTYADLPLKLTCNPCEPVYGVSWTKQSNPHDPRQRETPVVFDSPDTENKRVILGGDSAIYILRASGMDEGIYRCKDEEGVTISTYKVEVKPPGKMHVVRPPEVGGEGDVEPYGNQQRKGRLVMYTDWAEWGSCSECTRGKRRGERARLGYCFAMSQAEKYPLGLPCSSPEIQGIDRTQYSKRLDEKEIEACGGACPRDTIASNLTIFDQLLGKGRLQEQKVESNEGEYILLICPGIGLDSAVTWHNGSQRIDANYLARTGGRVHIDIYDGLQIFNLNRRDGQPYHCFVDGKRRATFRLWVSRKKIVNRSELVESFIYISILIGVYMMVFIIIMLAKHNIRRRQRVKVQI